MALFIVITLPRRINYLLHHQLKDAGNVLPQIGRSRSGLLVYTYGRRATAIIVLAFLPVPLQRGLVVDL